MELVGMQLLAGISFCILFSPGIVYGFGVIRPSVRNAFSKLKQTELPWTEHQAIALEENAGKYKLVLADVASPDGIRALRWRTMIREVPELEGYPVDFVQLMYRRLCSEAEGDGLSQTIPSVLPFVDDYEFASSGGIAGRVYGLKGIVDGTFIETPPISQIHLTLPLGYVLTEDGTIAYEVGSPRKEGYSLSPGPTGTIRRGSYPVQGNGSGSGNGNGNDINNDGLNKVAATTCVLLASAGLVGMLSHHLTVNVFWV